MTHVGRLFDDALGWPIAADIEFVRYSVSTFCLFDKHRKAVQLKQQCSELAAEIQERDVLHEGTPTATLWLLLAFSILGRSPVGLLTAAR